MLGFVQAQRAEAASAGAAFNILKTAGSQQNPLTTGEQVVFTVVVSNTSTTDDGITGLPAILCGQVLEIDSCDTQACPDGSELTGVLGFVGCEIVDQDPVTPGVQTGVASCVIDPASSSRVLITMKPCDTTTCPNFTGGQALIAKEFQLPLVKITKVAQTPISSPITGHFFQWVESVLPTVFAFNPNLVNDCNAAGAAGGNDAFYPPVPKICVTKDCNPLTSCFPDPVNISGTVTNCGEGDLANVTLSDSIKGAIPPADITCPAGVSLTALGPNEACTYSSSYVPPAPGDPITDTVTASGLDVLGQTQTATDFAQCSSLPTVPGASCTKTGTCPATGDQGITYALEFCADDIQPCPEGLKNCKLVDAATANGAPAAIDYTPDPSNPVPRLPNDNIPFDLAPGQCLKFTGVYSVACPHDVITVINNAQIVCDNATSPPPCTKTCEIPCCDNAKISQTKDCAPISQPVGGTVDVFGDTCNTGDVDLTNVTVVDNQGTVLTCTDAAGLVVTQPFSLAVGECVHCAGIVDCPAEGGNIPKDIFTATGTSLCGSKPVATATPPQSCGCETKLACWLTGGGVKFEPLLGVRMATANNGNNGPVISIGGNVNPGCSPTAGDGGNWNLIDHKAKLHFQGQHIEVVECGNIPVSIRPPGSDSPKTPFNYIEFQGTGILKGIGGNKYDAGPVTFYARAEDRNEPGSKETLGSNFIDRFWIRVFDAQGNTVYLFGNDVPNPDTRCGDDSFACTDTIAITGGNLQLHISGCDKIF